MFQCNKSGSVAARHTVERPVLYMGDCLEYMAEIPGNSVDMVLCDLPYGVTRCRWDSVIPFDLLWRHYKRVTKENGAIVLFGDGMFTANLMKSNPAMWRYNLIWDKKAGSDFLNANRKPLKCHEDILVFYGKPPIFNKQYWYSKPYHKTPSTAQSDNYGHYGPYREQSKDGRRCPLTILTFSKSTTRTHPTEKPVALCEYLIRTYSNEGETVLDNCMGSGTTGVACMNTGRRFIGIEKEPEYFTMAEQRIQQAWEDSNVSVR